ncbi:bifunctional methylenetetrahydrofolate dehydrogenase/methenyltetrahydrofolate cyclohydrolase FolD [Mechercharimyces sp. CAU 1602]|uniref:bifunctional methylenetetrahydrofolate dehydrogenase/methenyltetrahydrofolate cyclohydrolase FolD n=1 Tax=Mechercharimyces sp. CAU 1602 TaxID=2973933 RepID=UPI002163D0B1|nr:bifunctional methylenetetrahydrofolate dehydrogenase/methenyltetrahydrofolate cyclohydrolase FolD [Mechercharimyces sp. CAU 1602]MCS1350785.1 bifunctional methylenetetrahydrofolate dehydrogenase/methenyltetrahydrofolate cyclohydrolase FolD [Mechercharimyces sp. CAU 1602]
MPQTGNIIDGKGMAAQIRSELKATVQTLSHQGTMPGLAVVLVGEDPASQLYVRGKIRACEEVGIYSEQIYLTSDVLEEEVLAVIDRLNDDQKIHGILVQLPLPVQIDPDRIIERIDPAKDVDGFHPQNMGRLVIGQHGFLPCTPHGIMEMLKRSDISITGKHVVVVGRSNIVGKPISFLLQREHATVTMCHSRTRELAHYTKQADILIAAAGKAHLLGRDHISPNTVVIDVGMNRLQGRKVVGDVDFEAVRELASHITPVPGGVGPMTIAMLLYNTVEAAKQRCKE